MEEIPNLQEQKDYILSKFDFVQAAEIIYKIGRITECGDLIPWSKPGFNNLKIFTAEDIKSVVERLLVTIINESKNVDFIVWGPIKITKVEDRLTISLELTPWKEDA